MTTKPTRTVRLEPMTAAQYPAWEAYVVDGYAQAQVESGLWPAETAVELSRREISGLLPDGPASDGHHLWFAHDTETGVRVGALWIELRFRNGRMEAFVYDIHVASAQQGGGYGRAIMKAGSTAARVLGAESVALNVHGSNDRAYALYKSLGYEVTNRHMRLTL